MSRVQTGRPDTRQTPPTPKGLRIRIPSWAPEVALVHHSIPEELSGSEAQRLRGLDSGTLGLSWPLAVIIFQIGPSSLPTQLPDQAIQTVQAPNEMQ